MNRLKSFIIFILLLFANSIHAQDDCYKIDSIKNRIIFYVEGHIGSEKRDIMLDKVVKNLDWYPNLRWQNWDVEQANILHNRVR